MASPLFPTDTVKDIADSLGIVTLSSEAAKQLAMDVEFRIQEVVQEALMFMRHSKRTVLSPADISNALKSLNIEPMYGYNSSRPIKFREATTSDGVQLYYLDDEEVEFEKIINQPLPKIPREVEFIGHWLAIEGVQPAVVQNPTPAYLKSSEYQNTTSSSIGPSSSLVAASGAEEVKTKQQVKHVLSKELQLYFERIARSLSNEETEAVRETAIASIRNDPGLHQLVPYLVSFIAEKITHNLKTILVLNVMLQVMWALLDNPNLNIEPYLHQLMPSLLTCLVAKRLGDPTRTSARESYALRDFAASLLALIIQRYSSSYSTLKPRITRALLKAFLDNKKPLPTHYGAIAGLCVMGRETVRTLVVPNLKLYSDVLLQPALGADSDNARRYDGEKVLDAILKALNLLVSEEASAMDVEINQDVAQQLRNRVGDLIAGQLLQKSNNALIAELVS